MTARRAAMQSSVYVIYPAALLDGWEVVRERHHDEPSFFDTREQATSFAQSWAAMSGGGVVKLENWFGDTEIAWDVLPGR